ncbi:copper-containing nitrite reductase [Lutibaculum baratangense]|uniref:Copper-containing nitrite reductase n=1 Tax=Lutibaculum baratangense AMV1 TaxID=631454 RepID=V4RBB8_9HYPH|nr:copper-containing nitrite reductase [Lutibaculum baratangense]ESR23431.1 Copper-containing nitrite reductase [Lutibaculum baratangense AMV1]
MNARALFMGTAAAAVMAVAGSLAPVTALAEGAAANIVRAATDLPAPLARQTAETVSIELETIELVGQLDDGTTYRYWTFDGKVPGPFARVRVGDTVEVRLKNHEDSWMVHNVDFHAVTGLHGGGHATMADPGEESQGFTFKALNPGLYVYHCAVPLAAQHIANGMYGLILVEPEGGLPPVDREFYVMQGEIYTEEAHGSRGELGESYDKLLNEMPEYYVFNGAANALTEGKALHAEVGETVRIYFGVGGPNKTSSFHVIGEIFDKVYNLGGLTAEPLTDIQTISVPPGGAAAIDFKVEVPGEYILVDHALSRAARGLVGKLIVEGPEQPDVYREGVPERLGLLAE